MGVVKGIFLILKNSTITAHDPRTGVVRWTFEVTGTDPSWTESDKINWVISRPAHYLYRTNGAALDVLALKTGKRRLRFDGSGETVDWQTEDDIISVTSGNTLSVFDLETGVERWHFAGKGSDIGWQIQSGVLYTTSGNILSALDPDTGAERWRFAGTGKGISWDVEGDVVYTSSGKEISALDLKTGAEHWRFTGAVDGTSVRIVDGALFATRGPSISALDAKTGAERWRFAGSAREFRWRSDQGLIYIVSGKIFTALDPKSGSERWHFGASTAIADWQIDHGTLYLMTDNTFAAIDPKTGAQRWHFVSQNGNFGGYWFSYEGAFGLPLDNNALTFVSPETGASILQIESSESLLVDGGTIYVANGKAIAAFNLTKGIQLWRYPGRGMYSLQQVVNQTLFATSGNALRSLDKETGKALWSFDAKAGIASVEVSDGIIRMTDVNGTLYALGPKSVGLENGGAAKIVSETPLRGAPNTGAIERGTLPKGTTVTIIGISEQHDGVTWWPVRTDKSGEQGWVPADDLEPTSNAPAGFGTPVS